MLPVVAVTGLHLPSTPASNIDFISLSESARLNSSTSSIRYSKLGLTVPDPLKGEPPIINGAVLVIALGTVVGLNVRTTFPSIYIFPPVVLVRSTDTATKCQLPSAICRLGTTRFTAATP